MQSVKLDTPKDIQAKLDLLNTEGVPLNSFLPRIIRAGLAAEDSLSISDDLNQIEIALEKARYVLQDVVEAYFGRDPQEGNAALSLLIDLDRYGTKAAIVQDYLWEISKLLKELQAELTNENNTKGG